MPRYVFGQKYGGWWNSSRGIHSTDHLRLKSLILGLSAPQQWTRTLGIHSARIYFSGTNLLTWAAYDQYGPEMNGVVSFYTPPIKTFAFGLELKSYTKDQGAGWGAPIVDHPISLDENPPRSTVAQDYDFIIRTLEDAIGRMSDRRNNARMNRYAARALLSRVYLYHDEPQKAFQTASELIREVEQNGEYRLYTRDAYISSWDLDQSFGPESLFVIVNTTDDNGGRNSLAYLMHWNGYCDIFVTRKFPEALLSDPEDVRGQLLEKQEYQGNEVWWLKKWPGPNPSTPSFYNNYVIFRLSEVFVHHDTKRLILF